MKLNLFRFLLLVLLTGSLQSCQSQSCTDWIGNRFSNFQEAEKTIRVSKFGYQDKLNTTKSSWIVKAEYFSCDKESGYLLISTEKKSYLFEAVPVQVWQNFKKADSYGKFYNREIRGRYQIQYR